MDIREMIEKCDQSEIFTQNLADNFDKARIRHGNGLITFKTNPDFVLEMWNGSPKVAVIIWFPGDVFDR